ncbi:hypothetical protein Xcel_0393 [Xylanimonas cellulosilytica DSM 15894]|uniref:Uncharacterized protein n=1 Tax=Xylanimonas cellulosilytica (strain DSM 15894 / JCM 12276 / CECT 5975 / KCTC 9989 / LMG 20990 / NBRC 107835 / XIL07) TaxID=446471 RepID=D1BVG1_XYLCX|nr:hypothetical protein [Xylanimonas cellulosilytica]ACZ29432.1 hypothetical protein Xcel_0393 [Xylanimonas cellulosilytica DSM 15894]
MFTVMAAAADVMMAAQAGSLSSTLTVVGLVAVLVGIASLQAVSMWRTQN